MAKEVSSKANLLQAVQFVADSWQEIGSKTIQNCFSHCSLNHSGLEMPETAKTEYEAISEVQKVRNYEEFEGIDNNVECYNENEDCEDEIVESILSKHQEEEVRKVMKMTHLNLNE
jgi:Ran GTPase-activating protein (RanGAP) involved in mRNA processing and transport